MRRPSLSATLVGALGLLALALWLGAGPASAFVSAGAQGNVTLDSIGAPASAVWKVSATPLVYQVNESLWVMPGDVLQIPAGASVSFVNGTRLLVFGGLEVVGTEALPVRMRVVPDSGGMGVDWYGIRGEGAAPFRIENATVNDTQDVTFSNGTGALIRHLAYDGRLFIDNSTAVVAEDIKMDWDMADVGRVAVWVENSTAVHIRRADLRGGSGWARDCFVVENARDVWVDDVVERVDAPFVIGLDLIQSARVTVTNFTFTVGPTNGDPNQVLQLTDATDIWMEGLVMTHVGLTTGAIYGDRSNATIANSTFPAGLIAGVWRYTGRLTGVNATRLPVEPQLGAEVDEFELARFDVSWSAGGAVAAGLAAVTNASWNVTAAVASGATPWLWLLRETNASGAVNNSSAYTVAVTCNCTGASASFVLSDGPGVAIAVVVDDPAPPVPVAVANVTRTGSAGTLNGAGSFDNAAVAGYRWSVVGPANVAGLPCAQAVCQVNFFEPGNFTVELTVTDTSGNNATASLVLHVADATAPFAVIDGATPARPGQDEPFTVVAHATDNDPAFLPAIAWTIDGAPAPGDTLSPTFRISAIGDHLIRLVVRDDGGNVGQANLTVTVRDSTSPGVATWVAPTGLVAPATLALNGSVASDNVAVVSWQWRVTGPGTDYNLTGKYPNATLPSAGTYNVTLFVEDAEGNSASRTFAVEVAAAPRPGGFLAGGWPEVAVAALAAGATVALALRRRGGGDKGKVT